MFGFSFLARLWSGSPSVAELRRTQAALNGAVQSILMRVHIMSDNIITLQTEIAGLKVDQADSFARINAHLQILANMDQQHLAFEAELQAQIASLQAVPADTGAQEAALSLMIDDIRALRTAQKASDTTPAPILTPTPSALPADA